MNDFTKALDAYQQKSGWGRLSGDELQIAAYIWQAFADAAEQRQQPHLYGQDVVVSLESIHDLRKQAEG